MALLISFSTGLSAQKACYLDADLLGRKINSKSRYLEVAHGQAFTEISNSWAWMFHTNYLFQVREKLALGGGAGLQFDWTGLYPQFSLNSIYGNTGGGLAIGVDVRVIFTDIIDSPGERFWLSTGAYYKNFFVKMMPTFMFGYPGEWYFETGYSFPISK